MRICKACSTEIVGQTKKCEKCGLDQRSWVVRHPFLTFFLFVFLWNLVQTWNRPPNTLSTGALEITPRKWKIGDSDNRILSGTVKNKNTSIPLQVQIEYNLFDAAGHPIGNTVAAIDNLQPQGTLRFEIKLQDDAALAEIKRVSASAS